MLITQPQGHIFDRVLRTKEGKLVRVTFVVVSVGGELKAKVLNIAPLEGHQPTLKAAEILALPGKVSKVSILPQKKTGFEYKSILSPLQNLNFFISQPTRAPSTV
ncbi:MAG: hypothetical protein V4526_00185 [Patescibacteria group bacterium]